MKKLLCLTLLALAACSQDNGSTDVVAASSTAVIPALPVLSWDGYGPVSFGMTLAAAERLAGTRTGADRALDPACDYAAFAELPGMRFMVENGVITRGDAAPQVVNSLGIAVGSSLEAVSAAHPEAVVTPHKYTADGRYILFIAPAQDRAIVIETQDGAVTLIRAGLEPAVEYVESCS